MQESNFTSGSSGGQQQRRMHAIRPLTIKQLLEAKRVGEGVLVVDGNEITQAIVVGRIVEYENANMATGGALTAKHYGYRITDNTGSIVVRQWADTDTVQEPLPKNTHVRASGTVKVWQEAPIVTGTVVAVADSNELNYHALESILTHLRLTRGNQRPKDGAATGASGMAFQNNAAAVGAQNVLPGGDSKILLTDLLVTIMRQSANVNSGMSIDELAAAVQRYNFGANDVKTAIRVLTDEGQVFQTHDFRFAPV